MVSRSWPIDLFYIAKSMNQIDAWFDAIWMVMTPRKVAIRRWVYMTTSYFPTNLLDIWSERWDSNPRLFGSRPSTLTKLRYSP